MAKTGGSKTLKDQNRWQLWLVIAANAVVFYGACQWDAIALSGFRSALAGSANLLPVGLAVVVTTIANGKAWYRFYLEVQNVPAVHQVHRDFLLLRDYTGLAALFLVGLGLAAFFVIATWKVLAIYVGMLILQFVVVRHA